MEAVTWKHQGDHADLAEGERIGIPQDGIHGQHQGLQRVIDQMACGDGDQHRKNGVAGNAVFDCGHVGFPECQAPLASPIRSRQPGQRKADMSRQRRKMLTSGLNPALPSAARWPAAYRKPARRRG